MAFKRSTDIPMTSMVYEYHAQPPVTNLDGVRQQMRLAHKYQNELVAIERKRREDRDELMRQICPQLLVVEEALATLDSEREVLRTAVKSQRSAAHLGKEKKTRIKPDAETTAKIKELGARIKTLWAERKELRRALQEDEAAQAQLMTINTAAKAVAKNARADCGLYWGTYLIVEQAMDAAKTNPTPPRFHRWRGDGTIAVQIQNGLPVAGLTGEDTRIRLRAAAPPSMEPHAKAHSPKCKCCRCVAIRRRFKEVFLFGNGTMNARVSKRQQLRKKMVLSMRIGSEGRDPVFAEIPILMHRPLPANARVKWVKLLLCRIGLSERWRVQFTIEWPKMPVQRPDCCNTVEWLKTNASAEASYSQQAETRVPFGIDVGWRVRPGGALRVACGADRVILMLPPDLMESFDRCERIRSERDLLFNVARDRLVDWLRLQADLPEWVVEKQKSMHLWKSPAHLAHFALRWRAERLSGDEEIYAQSEHWRKRDAHLYQYEAHLRDQAIARRTNLYRVFASNLTKRESSVVLEIFNLSKVARLGPIEDENPLHQSARRMRTIACVSSLRICIKQAAIKNGCEVREVDAAYTTMECSACGYVGNFDRMRLTWQCPSCLNDHDQDKNAARNIAARG